MPRIARIKSTCGVYHIMVRSNSDISLFRDDNDKDVYLRLVRKLQQRFLFKIYGYCLMTTHAHMIIDSLGADISTIMKSINLSYAIYYNRRYGRHGNVFGDRFKSKLITTDNYLMMLSAYIHNNPKDMERFRECVEKYRYSSLGVYLGVYNDDFGLLDSAFILQQFGSPKSRAQEAYWKFMLRYADNNDSSLCDDFEFKNDGSEYRSERKIIIRNYLPENIVSFVSRYVDAPFNINVKYIRKNLEFKALSVAIMRSLCNFSLKQICSVLCNVTCSNAGQLCEKGLKLITENEKYSSIVTDLLKVSPSF